jgi:branched-chain amino acid transport system permease protein
VTEFVQNLIDGLGSGGNYAILALGVSLLFGVMHLVNFAHGELLTVSAYTMYALRQRDVPWPLVVIAAIAVAVLSSMLIEFLAFRRIRNASPFTLLLTSFAVEILSHAIWRTAVSSSRRTFTTPEVAFSTFEIGSIRVEWWDVATIVVTLACYAATMAALHRTTIGISMRAAAEDFDAARLMGVRSNRVISSAFALAGLLAGIAGIMYLLRRGQADPRMGAQPLLKAVIAAIIGGLGSLKGAVIGGLSLGVAEVLMRSWLSKIELGEGTAASTLVDFGDTAVFLLIAVLFAVRPAGLFKVTSAERV